MQKAEAFITSDGKIFLDEEKAKRHADDRYGDAVCKLATKVARCDKYSAAIDLIEESLDDFANILSLKSDLAIQETGE